VQHSSSRSRFANEDMSFSFGFKMKAKALANCEVVGDVPQKLWHEQDDVMAFLRAL
jgi:hypothetical protein